jgi:hypothetical protein
MLPAECKECSSPTTVRLKPSSYQRLRINVCSLNLNKLDIANQNARRSLHLLSQQIRISPQTVKQNSNELRFLCVGFGLLSAVKWGMRKVPFYPVLHLCYSFITDFVTVV